MCLQGVLFGGGVAGYLAVAAAARSRAFPTARSALATGRGEGNWLIPRQHTAGFCDVRRPKAR